MGLFLPASLGPARFHDAKMPLKVDFTPAFPSGFSSSFQGEDPFSFQVSNLQLLKQDPAEH